MVLMLQSKIADWLAEQDMIELAILFGSLSRGQENWDSDIDLAVAGESSLSAEEKMHLIEGLVEIVGRPVDLIDLHEVRGTILHQILTTGTLVYCRDHQLYAELIKQMLFDQADFMPYRERILAERREAWIGV